MCVLCRLMTIHDIAGIIVSNYSEYITFIILCHIIVLYHSCNLFDWLESALFYMMIR